MSEEVLMEVSEEELEELSLKKPDEILRRRALANPYKRGIGQSTLTSKRH